MSFILKTVYSFKSLTNLCSQWKKKKFIKETPELMENTLITQGPIWYWENDINPEFLMTYYTPEVFKTSECQTSFDILKRKFTEEPVLMMPNQTHPFQIECNTSKYTSGAVLTQTNINGDQHPISEVAKL